MKILFWMFIGFDKHTTSEHLLSAILEQLCKQGHSVHIIQKNTGGNLPAIPEKLADYPITTDVVPFHEADKRNFVARYLAELRYVNNCKKYFMPVFDAVFIQSTTVGGFAVKAIRQRISRAIVTFNVQDIFPYNAVYSGNLQKGSLVFKVLAWIQRYGYKHSDHVITISEDMKDTLVSDGTDAGKVEVVYNWSYQDEPYHDVDLSPVSHMFNPIFFNVVYAGNIGVMQNVDIIIETANLMKDENSVWFHIIGNGIYKEKLEERAKQYGITNITFWPMLPPELAPAIYCSASVNIIPLVKNVYRTALPSKTATCLACGKPIIFPIGTTTKLQRGLKGTGCYFTSPDDPQELKMAIHEIQDNESVFYNTEDVYKKMFSLKNNSSLYAKIISNIYGE